MPTNPPQARTPGLVEFVTLIGLLSAVDALSIDGMLPALQAIGSDLGAASSNDPQQIVTLFFLGMAAGPLVAGPLSDSIGRKPAVGIFLALYAVGTLLAIFAASFPVMLAGRMLQGFAAAGPFIITMAITRDLYEGDAMARINSFTIGVFVLVPMIAPMIGQGILVLFHWRAIFVFFLTFAGLVGLWFMLRQPETLAAEHRKPFRASAIWRALVEACTNRQALGYTIIEGLQFGAFLAYLSTAPQLFQDIYGEGARFPLWFALLAGAVGVAGLWNSALVLRFGMRPLTMGALAVMGVTSLPFLAWSIAADGKPPLAVFIGYLALILFCRGITAGNIAALVLQPLGHLAGMGSTVFGSLSALIAIPIGSLIGRSFDQSVVPLVAGFALLPLIAVAVMGTVERRPRPA